MSHKPNCLGYVCTCRGSALRTFCPGCESVPVKDPAKELCKDCDVKAELNRQIDQTHERSTNA